MARVAFLTPGRPSTFQQRDIDLLTELGHDVHPVTSPSVAALPRVYRAVRWSEVVFGRTGRRWQRNDSAFGVSIALMCYLARLHA